MVICRHCGWMGEKRAPRCPDCGDRRLLDHPELANLSLAHVDCDAFYASVEKRDRPELADQPVIVGGGTRGVVSAACYIARSYGVRSAMPMFKALALCPHATVIRPDMAKYSEAGRAVRAEMQALTPLVEPLSIDEAFLDLSGTEALHHGPPARTLVLFARKVSQQIGISVSIGLSHNKLMAKIASDLDKPRGFAIIGRAETEAFLAPRPVTLLWGVGKAAAASLARDGIRTIGDIARADPHHLAKRHGALGLRLAAFARGIDPRPVTPERPTKSISAETTFNTDITDAAILARELWPLAETVSRRLKKAGLAGAGLTLKLKTDAFVQRTRSTSLSPPTQLAETLWQTAVDLARPEADGTTRFRLIGLGCDRLVSSTDADPPDLLSGGHDQYRRMDTALDAVEAKLGPGTIRRGRNL